VKRFRFEGFPKTGAPDQASPFVHLLAKAADAIDRYVMTIGRAATWLALLLAAVIIFDVITRRFLVLGSTKLQEMEWHLHTVLFMFCVGFAYIVNAHVRIDLFRDKLSQGSKSWIEVIGCLVFAIPYVALLLFLSISAAYDSYRVGEISSAGTGLPYRWVIKSCMSIGFLLLLLACISVLFRHILLLFAPPALAREVRATMDQRSGFAAERVTVDDPQRAGT
jgi:TRAP-type mannitol/chloroaromatic compound transport system permease small subunit